jgi:hypothetical protein
MSARFADGLRGALPRGITMAVRVIVLLGR